MSISAKVMALLSLTGHKQIDLLNVFGMASRQSLGNKFQGDRWSADDLVKVAEFTGCKLAFILPDGERILLGSDQASGPLPAGDVPGPGVG